MNDMPYWLQHPDLAAKAPPDTLPDLNLDPLEGLTDPSEWQDKDIPPREWIIDGWLPAGVVTLVAGQGGTGKSLAVQQLHASCATGQPWLGLPVKQCRVLSILGEDDGEELARRQQSINRYYRIQFSDLKGSPWWSGAGRDTLTCIETRTGISFTPLMDAIEERVKAIGAGLVILDNIARLFGGNENARSQVNTFVARLERMAIENRCAVLLVGHPAKAADSEYSGSSHWSNAVRSRWFLERAVPEEDGDAADTNLRILHRKKANYAAIDIEHAIRWDEGVLKPVSSAVIGDAVDRMEARNREREVKDAFLKGLDAIIASDRSVTENKNGGKYAPKLIAKTPAAKGFRQHELERAMFALFDEGTIRANMVVGKKPNRHPLIGIGRADGASELRQSASESPESAAPESEASAPESPAKSLKTLASECCASVAPECASDEAKSLKSLRQRCAREVSYNTTYYNGGAHEGAPPHEDEEEQPNADEGWRQ